MKITTIEPSPRSAVFLDRDGVINALLYHQDVGIVDSPFTEPQFRVLPRVPRAIRMLNDLGLPVIVISNQPGIAKGHFNAAMLHRFDQKLKAALLPAGAHIDATYYCLHHPDASRKGLRKRCACRKPGIGMLLLAARDHGISLAESYMVGDGLTDIEAGSRAGCRTVFVGRWKCEHAQFIHPSDLRPSLVAKDLYQAAQLIAAELRLKSGGVDLASGNGVKACSGRSGWIHRTPSRPVRTQPKRRIAMTSSSRIRKVVIPAAGLGRRFLPATKVLPKEMLPVAGRPLIQFAVEEAAASGIETVILVIGKGKNLLKEHFRTDVELESVLMQRGYHEDAELVHRISQLAEIRTAWQQAPLGLADAVRSARSLVGDEPFAVILPDALIDSEVPCIGQLMDFHARHPGCVIATRKVDSSEVERFGIMDVIPMQDPSGGRVLRVNSLTERPRPGPSPRYGIFGRYILEPEIFAAIERTYPGFGGELQLTDALLVCSSSVPLYAYPFAGTHHDAGSKLGFLQATLAYALKDPELAQPLREYLAALQLDFHPSSISVSNSA